MALSAAEWKSIQAGFMAGHSVRSLAMVYRVDESTIREKAKRFGWQRDPKGDAYGSAPWPTETKSKGQPAPTRSRKSGPGRGARAERVAAKQQRLDALIALLDIAQSPPPVGDATADARRARALEALAGVGGVAATMRKASDCMQSVATAHAPSAAPNAEG